MGKSLAILNIFGKTSVIKEALNTVSRGFDNMDLINLNIPIRMLNGPVDIFAFNFVIFVSISAVYVGNK